MILNFTLLKNSNTKIRSENIKMDTGADDEMALSEHIEEFSQRTVFCIVIIGTITDHAILRGKMVTRANLSIKLPPGASLMESVIVKHACFPTRIRR